MFKARRGSTKEEIIILDPYWREETIGLLRRQGRDDELICPVCKQPVLVRAGKKKRWHFAHKDLTNCPLKNESPNILQARILLYSWLKSKLGEKVTIEKYFPESNLPRPIDCYVELSADKKIGYWILDKGIRDRWVLKDAFSSLGISTVWVPLTTMLREDDEDLDSVHLTPTERELSFSSDYNQLYSRYDESLSYLNVEEKTVLTLRGLHCVHSPQKYRFFSKQEAILDQVSFSPLTGEFVHLGEYDRLLEHRKEIEEQERLEALKEQQRREEEKKRQQKITEQQNRFFSQTESQTEFSNQPLTKSPYPLRNPPENKKTESGSSNYYDKPYTCKICGKTTTTWSSLDLADNTCICSYECLNISNKNK